MRDILFLGPKPPPVTGYANIVNTLAQCFMHNEFNIKYVSTLPNIFYKLFPSRLWKIIRVLYLFILVFYIMIKVPFYSMVYININGGFAQVFDILFVVIARAFSKTIVIHHNSYSYINKKNWISRLLFLFAGKNAKHIVNCMDMHEKLKSKYNNVQNVDIISNVAILTMVNPEYFDSTEITNSKLEVDEKNKIFTIGFMGYYNAEKGVDIFSEVVQQVQKTTNNKVRGIAVGPEHDKELMQKLKQNYGDIIDYRPPAYGQIRDKFFTEIDVLLFPSRYTSEAEPLTIHHALAVGIPVISTNIGCLAEVINQFSGCYSFSVNEYIRNSIKIITDMSKVPVSDRKKLNLSLITSYKQYSFENINHFKKILDTEFILKNSGLEDATTI